MTAKTHTAMTVALIVGLVAIGVVAGLGPAFPTGVNAAAGWSFLGGHAYALAHTLLAVVVLVFALILVGMARSKLVPTVILAGVVVAGAAGAVYVSADQPEVALGLMTVGWLVSLIAAIVQLVRQRRVSKA